MTRRDTIIIAVLVNAALLLVLFATSSSEEKSSVVSESSKDLAKAACEPAPVVVDPLEEVLSQYVKAPLPPATPQESTVVLADALAVPAEPVAPVVPQQAPTNVVSITVKKGDVLEKIARANGSSVAAIMHANDLHSTNLKIGQVLKVPLQKQKPLERLPVSSHAEYYVVQDGDNPWLIASKNHVKLDELLRINGLDEAKARRLRPGDKLRLR